MAEPTTTSSLSLQNFFSTTLSGAITASTTVIPLNSVPNASEGFLVLDQDNSAREVIYYTSKGASSVTCPDAATGRGLGDTSATSHLNNATVKQNVVSEYFLELQNGHALGSNAILGRHLATSAITLGYTPVTAITGFNSTAGAQQLTGLTTTVTIPAGGRKIKITGFLPGIADGTVSRTILFTIWDGVVASGTQLALAQKFVNSASEGTGMFVQAIVTPAAGSKTYNLGISDQSTGALTFPSLSSTAPAFILVEAI